MGGGLMQLVAYGAQDVYLTGNPQITFFKVVYRRHTNFSIECIEIPMDGSDFGKKSNVLILRNGDLVNKMYIKTTLPSLYNYEYYVKKVGYVLLKSIECTIGGSIIDKHFGLYYDIWYELTHTTEQENGFNSMIGNVPELNNIYKIADYYKLTNIIENDVIETRPYTIYIPLEFWFNRNIGLSLPLIALQYHEVRFSIEFENLENLINIGEYYNYNYNKNSYNLSNTSLLVDYIFLDQEERRRMAQVGHEYLIEQIQYNDSDEINNSNKKFLLDFNHPCKEIIWATRCNLFNKKNTFLVDYTGNTQETLDYAAINIASKMLSYLNPQEEVQQLYTQANGWYKLSNLMNPADRIIPANTTKNISIYLPNKNMLNIICSNTFNVQMDINTFRTYYINIKSFIYNDVNLSDNIMKITLSLYIVEDEDNGITKTYYSQTRDKVIHNLNLENVSIPIEQFSTQYSLRSVILHNNVASVTLNQPTNYGLDLAGNGNLVNYAQLQLNGYDRFDKQSGKYFNYVQPHQHHTRTPPGGIYSYSFGINPEQHQPSGTCNLSRIDNTILILTFADTLRNGYPNNLIKVDDILTGSDIFIYTRNYNVLRIMSGMAGIAYAN